MEINKVSAFEYLLFKLVIWHKEVTNEEQNDISVLKALKLLFFVSAANTDESGETLLDTVFNEFVAMPYGHVESDVYENIKNRLHSNIIIDRRSTTIIDTFSDENLDKEIRSKIDSNIQALKENNNKIIKYSSFELVDLSHTWYSWKYYFSKAKESNINSHIIPLSVIKKEDKFFSLA
ncbi:type II toxin-antitoxin system antitoxin SocA domain-containing protein [Galbibacter sp.]|uniref:type II toxin-antitoxin system antitoxin SocA domain-containing protein n=1 Tax=Galbibacter sp. TaxID=2918471 RepID=UPI003A90D0BD